MLKFCSLPLFPSDIFVSLLLKVEELVQQSYSFYNGYNGSNDKAPLIPQVYAYRIEVRSVCNFLSSLCFVF